jgi:hypothetical protein
MNCPKCSTGNAEQRRFCRECGAMIVTSCSQCGFGNALSDKFCGGCGFNLAELTAAVPQSGRQGFAAQGSGRYSHEDITELIGGQTQKTEPAQKKKERKASDAVSQDFLDSIFDSSDSD